MEDAVEIGEVQRVRHRYQPNDHGVDIAENCSQNQSFEGCCWHVLQPTPTPDFVLLSTVPGTALIPMIAKSLKFDDRILLRSTH
jgi:hypothetical protein